MAALVERRSLAWTFMPTSICRGCSRIWILKATSKHDAGECAGVDGFTWNFVAAGWGILFWRGAVAGVWIMRADVGVLTMGRWMRSFFAGTTVKSELSLCNMGYGDSGKVYPRGPRLGFEEVCKIDLRDDGCLRCVWQC